MERIKGKTLFVRLEYGETAKFSEADLTNYSLAARKAWERMPHRRVGRPKGTSRTDRVSVTLRINRDLWKQFKLAEQEGLIVDRTATVNEWIQEKLNELNR